MMDFTDTATIELYTKLLITISFIAIYIVMYLRDKRVSQWIIFVLGGIITYWFRR